jgi:hypothetical protein
MPSPPVSGGGTSPGPEAVISWERALSIADVALALALLVTLAVQLARPDGLAQVDFTVFRTGWALALHDPHRLYDAQAQAQVQGVVRRTLGDFSAPGGLLAFLHPPHMALAGVGLEWLAERWGERPVFLIWAACNVALFIQLTRQMRRRLELDARGAWILTAALAGFAPVFLTFAQGQLSLLLGVAAFGLAGALAERRPVAVAGYLLLLSLKPLLLPPLLIVLAARREWRALGASAVLLALAFGTTALVLGPYSWLDYLHRAPELERLHAGGARLAMPTLGGALARLLPAAWAPGIDRFVWAAWLASAVAVTPVILARRRAAVSDDARVEIAFALALGLFASPHLYQHDLVLWLMPLVEVLARAKMNPARWRTRVRFALAWPIWAVAAQLDPRHRLPIDPALVPLVILLVWTLREVVPPRTPATET